MFGSDHTSLHVTADRACTRFFSVLAHGLQHSLSAFQVGDRLEGRLEVCMCDNDSSDAMMVEVRQTAGDSGLWQLERCMSSDTELDERQLSFSTSVLERAQSELIREHRAHVLLVSVQCRGVDATSFKFVDMIRRIFDIRAQCPAQLDLGSAWCCVAPGPRAMIASLSRNRARMAPVLVTGQMGNAREFCTVHGRKLGPDVPISESELIAMEL